MLGKKKRPNPKRRVPEGIRKVPEEFPEVNPEGQFLKQGDVRVSSKPHIYIYIYMFSFNLRSVPPGKINNLRTPTSWPARWAWEA